MRHCRSGAGYHVASAYRSDMVVPGVNVPSSARHAPLTGSRPCRGAVAASFWTFG